MKWATSPQTSKYFLNINYTTFFRLCTTRLNIKRGGNQNISHEITVPWEYYPFHNVGTLQLLISCHLNDKLLVLPTFEHVILNQACINVRWYYSYEASLEDITYVHTFIVRVYHQTIIYQIIPNFTFYCKDSHLHMKGTVFGFNNYSLEFCRRERFYYIQLSWIEILSDVQFWRFRRSYCNTHSVYISKLTSVWFVILNSCKGL